MFFFLLLFISIRSELKMENFGFQELTTKNFTNFTSKPSVIIFYAPWDQELFNDIITQFDYFKRYFDTLAFEKGFVDMGILDASTNSEFNKKYNVLNFPAYLFFENKILLEKKERFVNTKELKTKIFKIFKNETDKDQIAGFEEESNLRTLELRSFRPTNLKEYNPISYVILSTLIFFCTLIKII